MACWKCKIPYYNVFEKDKVTVKMPEYYYLSPWKQWRRQVFKSVGGGDDF